MVEPHPARAEEILGKPIPEELLSDPLVQRLAKLEADWWDQRDGE